MTNYYDINFAEQDRAWDWFVDCGLCTEETLRVVTSINGYSMDTMRNILYVLEGTTTFPYEEE